GPGQTLEARLSTECASWPCSASCSCGSERRLFGVGLCPRIVATAVAAGVSATAAPRVLRSGVVALGALGALVLVALPVAATAAATAGAGDLGRCVTQCGTNLFDVNFEHGSLLALAGLVATCLQAPLNDDAGPLGE